MPGSDQFSQDINQLLGNIDTEANTTGQQLLNDYCSATLSADDAQAKKAAEDMEELGKRVRDFGKAIIDAAKAKQAELCP